MSGFIDPSAPADARLDRLEALVCEMLEQVNPDTLSTEGRVLLWSLVATKPMRDAAIRARIMRMAGIKPEDVAR